MSSSSAGTPALAKCAAIRDPIVPAPRTATRRSDFIRLVNPNRECSAKSSRNFYTRVAILHLRHGLDNQCLPVDRSLNHHSDFLDAGARDRIFGGDGVHHMGIAVLIQLEKIAVVVQQRALNGAGVYRTMAQDLFFLRRGRVSDEFFASLDESGCPWRMSVTRP